MEAQGTLSLPVAGESFSDIFAMSPLTGWLYAHQNKVIYSQTCLWELYLLMCLWSVIKCHKNQENMSMKGELLSL